MKRIVGTGLVALLVGTASLTAVHGTAAAGHPRGAMANTAYRASTLYPRNNSIATGAMIGMPAPGGTKVMLYVAYLAPMEVYHEQVQSGTCAQPGPVMLRLPDTQADADGSINVMATLNTSVPTGGVVTVQRSFTSPIASCGSIHAPGIVVPLTSLQHSPDSTANGVAVLTRTMGNSMMQSGPMTLGTEIVVYAQNMTPSSVHEEHIHQGVCGPDAAGQVLLPLTDVEADQNGEGVASTFTDRAIPAGPAYINVHALTLQPATCGNLPTQRNGY